MLIFVKKSSGAPRLVPKAGTTRSQMKHHSDVQMKIPVVVVESHHHALEHIHNVLRRRRFLNKEWSMLHFDSHADLACPGQHISAISCFRPTTSIQINQERNSINDEVSSETSAEGRNLYESLDSTASGIAEWILPLVLAANLRSILWMRPPGTVPLIPLGDHEYHVGVWIPSDDIVKRSNVSSFLDLPLTATLKADFACPYYLDDDSYVPSNELVLVQPLHLTVSEEPYVKRNGIISEENLLSLDICLDYFACVNPFLRDIELLNSAFAHAFRNIVIQTKFYNDSATAIENYQREILTFRLKLQEVLESYRNDDIRLGNSPANIDCLIPFYDTPNLILELVETMQVALHAHEKRDEFDYLIQMAVEAIPHAMMPHTFLAESDFNDTIEQRILCFRQKIAASSYPEPFLITVARSAEDGFTPEELVDELQVLVLHEIHTRYCGCDNILVKLPTKLSKLDGEQATQISSTADCRLQLIFDYGAWEGFTVA
jgi:UPF0489 domain